MLPAPACLPPPVWHITFLGTAPSPRCRWAAVATCEAVTATAVRDVPVVARATSNRNAVGTGSHGVRRSLWCLWLPLVLWPPRAEFRTCQSGPAPRKCLRQFPSLWTVAGGPRGACTAVDGEVHGHGTEPRRPVRASVCAVPVLMPVLRLEELASPPPGPSLPTLPPCPDECVTEGAALARQCLHACQELDHSTQ